MVSEEEGYDHCAKYDLIQGDDIEGGGEAESKDPLLTICEKISPVPTTHTMMMENTVRVK